MTGEEKFTCEVCGGCFIADNTKEECLAEAEAVFSPEELTDPVSVCDECWMELRAALPELDARYREGS
jgi:hypothetical protein